MCLGFLVLPLYIVDLLMKCFCVWLRKCGGYGNVFFFLCVFCSSICAIEWTSRESWCPL